MHQASKVCRVCVHWIAIAFCAAATCTFLHIEFEFSFHCSDENVTHILSLFTVTASFNFFLLLLLLLLSSSSSPFTISIVSQMNFVLIIIKTTRICSALEIIRIVGIFRTTTVTVASWFYLNFSWPFSISLSVRFRFLANIEFIFKYIDEFNGTFWLVGLAWTRTRTTITPHESKQSKKHRIEFFLFGISAIVLCWRHFANAALQCTVT